MYSFFLPIYSFWCMDDFSWGNTRVVIGDGGSKKVVMNDDERFDESMIPLKKFSGESCVWICVCLVAHVRIRRVRNRSMGRCFASLGRDGDQQGSFAATVPALPTKFATSVEWG